MREFDGPWSQVASRIARSKKAVRQKLAKGKHKCVVRVPIEALNLNINSEPESCRGHMSWTDRIAERREIGVVVERHAIASQWATHRWHPSAVLLDVPETAVWTKLGEEGPVARFYAGPATITLVPSETESYIFNLGGREPLVWIILRPASPGADGRDVELESATVAAGEAEALAGGIDIIVESVPMPREIAQWVAAFAAQHQGEKLHFKRKRSHHVSEGKAIAEEMERKRRDE